MGWTWRRRIRIGPGVRLNLSRTGPSLSIGRHGYTKTYSARGVRTTIGIPGTGLSHTTFRGWTSQATSDVARTPPASVPDPGKAPPNPCATCGADTTGEWLYCPSCKARI
jgi:hypothetical protein